MPEPSASSAEPPRMPNIEDLSAQMEADLEWRREELRSLESILLNNDLEIPGEEHDRQRKCLCVMLYSHYEGFFKFALETYATALNSMGIECKYIHERLISWSLEPIFHDVEFNESKEPLFASHLPTDNPVHRVYRRSRLIQEWRSVETRELNIPDTAYSTKSNLDYDRLQVLLYQSGFDHNCFDARKADIAHLVIRRHSIAHGNPENRVTGIGGKEYSKMRRGVFESMVDFIIMITKSLSDQSYMRPEFRLKVV